MTERIEYFGKDLEAMLNAVNYNEWILEHFLPYLGKKIAEIGAGTGNFSEFLVRTDIDHLTAFEPSDNMYEVLADRFRDNQRVATKKSFFDSRDYRNAFDSILYINVLEHIEDDREAMRHAFEALRPGGHVMIFVPALSFLYSELDRKVGHFRRYSKKKLLDVVGSAGFSIRKAQYFDIAGIIPWYIAVVLLKQTTTSTNVSLYDKLVVPVMRIVERVIPPCTGKNLILVGRKESGAGQSIDKNP